MEIQLLHRIRELLDLLERTAGETSDLNSKLQNIAQIAKQFFTADATTIFAINPITTHLIISLSTAGNQLMENTPYELSRQEELMQQILKHGILVLEDLETTSEYHDLFAGSIGICSFVGLALRTIYRHQPLGALYLTFSKPQQFGPDCYELLQFFADQASFILQETWLLQRYRDVARIGQEINQDLSTPEKLFRRLKKQVAGILDISHGFSLAVYQPQTNTLDLYVEEDGCFILRHNEPLTGAYLYTVETLQPLLLRKMSEEARYLPFQFVDTTQRGSHESLIFVPLVLRDISLGVLSIQHPHPHSYGQEDVFILQLLANHIALALYNMRLYNNLSQLNETGQLLAQQLESEHTLQETVEKIREATKADIVILYIYEPALEHFMLPPHIAGHLRSSPPQAMYPRQPNDIVAVALHHQEPIFARESTMIYSELPGDVRIRQEGFQKREQIRSVAIMPLKVGENSIGVLFVNFREVQHFDSSQKKLIAGLAHYAAIAIKNAQKYGSLAQRRVRELEVLQGIDRELSYTLDLETVLSTLLRRAREQVPAEEASILLYNKQRNVLETAVALGRHAEISRTQIIPLQQTKGITRWVWVQKEPVRIDNVHNDLRWRDLHLPVADDTISELDIPLLNDNEVIGILSFESPKEAAFHRDDQHFLLTLAGQAVLAIKNAQTYEREKRLAAEFQVLNDISKEIVSRLDSDHIFDLILEKALELTQSARGTLMLYDPDQKDLWMAAERGVDKDKKGLRQSQESGVVGYVARTKKLLNVDPSQPPWKEVYMSFIPGMCSELAVPMLAGDDLRGVLNIESPVPNRFSDSDERLLQGLADLAVIALQNAQAYGREKRLAAESQVLNEISKEITSQLDLTHVFDLILENALELTHSALCSLMLYDPDRNELWMAAQRGLAEDKKDIRQQLCEGIVGYVARMKKLLNVDPSQSPWNEIYREVRPGARSELAVPMLMGDGLRGVLNVESPTPKNFTERDERLLQGLADLAVVALQNAQAYEQEKRLAAESQILNEISKEIASQLDLTHVFDLILEKALDLSHSTLGSLHIYNPDLNDLWMAAERGVAQNKKGIHRDLKQGIVGYVATHKQLCNVGDISQSPWNEVYEEYILGTRSELAVPLLAGNELRGVLNVESPSLNNFNESDERLLQELADLAVVALQNAQAYAREKRFAAEAQVLNEISKEITSQLDPALVFDFILEKALELTHSHMGNLMLYDPIHNDLWMATERGVAQNKKGLRQKLSQGIVGHIATQKRLLNITDVSQVPWSEIFLEYILGTRSELAVPLLAGNELRGVLNVESPSPNNFNESDEHLLQGLADLAVVALQNAQAYENAKRDAQRFALLYQAGQELGRITAFAQLEQAYEIILRIAEEFGQCQMVISRYNEDSRELVMAHTSAFPSSFLFHQENLDVVINGQVIREPQTIVIHDTRELPSDIVVAPSLDQIEHPPFIIPIVFKDQYYGNLMLWHKDTSHFHATDKLFFEWLAQQLASTIYRLETVQARQEAEEMSSIGQIAFALTHRLDNALGLVETYVNTIRRVLVTQDGTNEIVSEKLGNIQRAARTVLDLSEALKDALARSGEVLASESLSIPPKALLEEIREALVLPTNIQVHLEVDEEVANIRVIPSLVYDILHNLLTNAVQAMPNGGKIILKARNMDVGNAVALDITDTGVGIPQERLPKIFGLFYSTKGSYGFGLWNARRNALKNGGDLKVVESQLGQGTTFRLLVSRVER